MKSLAAVLASLLIAGKRVNRGHVHMMTAHGGGGAKANAVRKLNRGGYVKMQMRGGGLKI